MLDTIKKISAQTGQTAVPAAFMYGSIISMNPLCVWVDNRFEIGQEALVSFKDTTLTAGDKVVLLRNYGGQQYLILGKVD